MLITGIAGFVGGHLTRHLLETVPDLQIHGAVLANTPTNLPPSVHLHALDLNDVNAVATLIAQVQPDHIYHLAAWAAVAQSFDRPWETIENNVRIQLNLFLGCIRMNVAPRILAVTSGEIYGTDVSPDMPTPESAPFRPANPYAVSKVTQDMLALQYFLSHQLPIIRVRPFNHLGPGQATGFVAPDLAQQIAQIEAGQREPTILCGDLSTERDFTDVRDIVRAYHLLLEHGAPGEAYNVASGRTYPIRYVLETLLSFTDEPITIRSNSGHLRSSGVRKSWGDSSKLHAATGWTPQISLETTLHDVLNDFRQRVQATPSLIAEAR